MIEIWKSEVQGEQWIVVHTVDKDQKENFVYYPHGTEFQLEVSDDRQLIATKVSKLGDAS